MVIRPLFFAVQLVTVFFVDLFSSFPSKTPWRFRGKEFCHGSSTADQLADCGQSLPSVALATDVKGTSGLFAMVSPLTSNASPPERLVRASDRTMA